MTSRTLDAPPSTPHPMPSLAGQRALSSPLLLQKVCIRSQWCSNPFRCSFVRRSFLQFPPILDEAQPVTPCRNGSHVVEASIKL